MIRQAAKDEDADLECADLRVIEKLGTFDSLLFHLYLLTRTAPCALHRPLLSFFRTPHLAEDTSCRNPARRSVAEHLRKEARGVYAPRQLPVFRLRSLKDR